MMMQLIMHIRSYNEKGRYKMMVTNWFGVFTVLLASHSIVAMIAWIAGREGQDKTDNKISVFMSREWLENTNTNKGEK
jgi:hypothetical protein